MTSDLWYPLLALFERTSDDPDAIPSYEARRRLARPPSDRLREAIVTLCQVLQEELGDGGRQVWLLLDTGAAARPPAESATPSPLEVGRVLEELRLRFQDLRPSPEGSPPDFEAFLREKMRSLGFDDLGTAPLLPELQREALRGLGVGLGSQMAQLLGRLAGWHGESKAARPRSRENRANPGVRLLRLELGAGLAADKATTAGLRHELGKVRRRVSQRLGWELGGVQLAVSKEVDDQGWRLLLRGVEAASGNGGQGLAEQVEVILGQRAEALLPFAEFEAMLRQPGCKLVVKELRSLGLEKAMLWTVCRRVVAAGGHMREPLTVLERILEASTTSQQLPFLVQAVLSSSAEL